MSDMPDYIEYPRTLVLKGHTDAWRRWRDKVDDYLVGMEYTYATIMDAFKYALESLKDVPVSMPYAPPRPKAQTAKQVERSEKAEWGLTAGGHVVPIGDGRLEAEEKADPVKLVSGEGWPKWLPATKSDIKVRKTAPVQSRKQAAAAVTTIDFD